MAKEPIIPSGLESYCSDWHFSPALASGGFVFCSGFTGAKSDGTVSVVPEEQYRQAFQTLAHVLSEASLGMSDIVEMTTYHVGLRLNLDVFRSVKDEFVEEPFPAWTAIGVSELAVEGAVIEIRVIARQRNS